jgi:hypothetical protein
LSGERTNLNELRRWNPDCRGRYTSPYGRCSSNPMLFSSCRSGWQILRIGGCRWIKLLTFTAPRPRSVCDLTSVTFSDICQQLCWTRWHRTQQTVRHILLTLSSVCWPRERLRHQLTSCLCASRHTLPVTHSLTSSECRNR